MPAVQPEVLNSLQSNTKNIRNICILAHVDHGKTTLSDRLISSNGIISGNLAGKIRYLDARPDEIERRITMKSSCISLLHKDKKAQNQDARENQYLVHLIDSPGHVDFSSEVSTAVRISDGAIIVVDVLEGVCIQTISVIRQAWNEKLKATLVLNKVDRLITELQMTATEAYERMQRILEQLNAIVGQLLSTDVIKQIDTQESGGGEESEEATVLNWEQLGKSEENIYFSPEKGNVIFGSALEGWGFSIEQFVDIWVKKLGVKKEMLKKTLWGEYFFNTKTKRIHTKNFNGKMTPMFVQFVLNSIWDIFNACKYDRVKLEKIVNTLQLKVNLQKLANEEADAAASQILNKWLPMSETALQMVIENLPSPVESQRVRIPKIWQPPVGANEEMAKKLKEIEQQMINCDVNGETVVFVSKIFPLPKDAITGAVASSKAVIVPGPRIVNPPTPSSQSSQPSSQPIPQPSDSNSQSTTSTTVIPTPVLSEKPALHTAFRAKNVNEKFIAFARIFSGTLRKGAKVHILGPRYNPAEPTKHHSVMEVDELFMLMGREVEPVNEVYAGNVFGIGGVEDFIIKTATIASTEICSTFNPMAILSSPIVRVALEAENPSEMSKVVEGLKVLNQADPCVEIYVQETGEHVIVAAGELHLERCLRDLRENYARVPIRASAPLVAFRETITDAASLKFAKQANTVIATANKMARVKVKAVPLPENLMMFLRDNAAIIRRVFVEESVNLQENEDIETFRKNLLEEFKKAGPKWEKEIDFVWAFGPRRIGPNILLNHIPGFSDSEYWTPLLKKMAKDYKPQMVHAKVSKKKIEQVAPAQGRLDIYDENTNSDKEEEEPTDAEKKTISLEDKVKMLQEFDNSILNGFQLATLQGPLCEEPMMGVCLILEDIEFLEKESEKLDSIGPFTGQLMSAMKEGCRQAFLSKASRLMEPMYFCDIQVPSEFMGKAYAVLGRRRAKILNEEVKEGGIFYIQSKLPVAESFGLSEQMLTQTSGGASVQLVFHNWEILDVDPFWVATTDEELEDYGENVGGIAPNLARKYMDEVRKRKGLRVEEQIVKFGDKQRTLSKKK